MNMSGMDMAPEWLPALLAWPVILAQTLIFGSATLCLILRRSAADGAASSDTLARALAGWWRILALVVAIVSWLMLLDQVAGMAGVNWRAAIPLLGEVLAQTQGGHIWEWRLPATLVLLAAAWTPMRDSVRALSLALLAAALLLGGSLMSHAIDFGAVASHYASFIRWRQGRGPVRCLDTWSVCDRIRNLTWVPMPRERCRRSQRGR
jgi:hypothetical protein